MARSTSAPFPWSPAILRIAGQQRRPSSQFSRWPTDGLIGDRRSLGQCNLLRIDFAERGKHARGTCRGERRQGSQGNLRVGQAHMPSRGVQETRLQTDDRCLPPTCKRPGLSTIAASFDLQIRLIGIAEHKPCAVRKCAWTSETESPRSIGIQFQVRPRLRHALTLVENGGSAGAERHGRLCSFFRECASFDFRVQNPQFAYRAPERWNPAARFPLKA